MKVLKQAVEDAGCRPPAPGYDGDTSEHARRIIELVLASNPVGKRAA